MKSISIKKLYALHSWVGITTGILLFIIAFTGAVAVFARPELKIWSNEIIRGEVPQQPQKIEEVLEQYANKVGDDYLEEIHIALPSAKFQDSASILYEGHFKHIDTGKEEHKGFVYQLHPTDYSLIKEWSMDDWFNSHQFDMATFLAHFHADLHLGRPVGLILTGLLGLTLMVSIVTGLFVHRKILRQLFTFRPQNTFSLMLNDGHKVMSVWAVLFHSAIAFTGAFLGLATVILVPAAAYVGFNGDEEKLVETFTAITPPTISYVQQPTQVADILEQSFKNRPDLTFNRVTILGYGDKNALVYVFGSGSDHIGGETLVYEGASANYIRSQANFGRLEGVTGKLLDAMFPLHFGNFGGILVKSLWAILGLATALLPITGLMLWIERGLHSKNAAHSKQTYENFSRLLIGSCGGIVLATVVLFPTQLLANAWLARQQHTDLIFTVFFSTWALVAVMPFIFNRNKTLKALTIVTAWTMMLVMPLDAMLTGSHLLNMFETKHFVSNSVNLVLLVLGGLLIVSYNKLEKNHHQVNRSSDNQLETKETQL